MCLAGFVLSAVPSPSPWYSCWQDLWFQHFSDPVVHLCRTVYSWVCKGGHRVVLVFLALPFHVCLPELNIRELGAVNTYSMMSLEVLVAAREGNTSVSSLSIFSSVPCLSSLFSSCIYCGSGLRSFSAWSVGSIYVTAFLWWKIWLPSPALLFWVQADCCAPMPPVDQSIACVFHWLSGSSGMCGDHCLTTKRFWYFSFAHKLVASIFVYLGEFRLSFKISCPQYIKSVYNKALHFWEMLWNDKKAWKMLTV